MRILTRIKQVPSHYLLALILLPGGLPQTQKILLSYSAASADRLSLSSIVEGPSPLELKEVFSIDSGADISVARGMAKIQGFDIDEKRSLYVLGDRAIVQFDAKGRHLRSFGGLGQGPGEFLSVANIIGLADGVLVTDLGGQKIIIYSGEGKLVRELKIRRGGLASGYVLKNGRLVLAETGFDSKNDRLVSSVSLVSPSFETLKEIERNEYPNPFSSSNFEAGYYNVIWRIGGDRIFTGHQSPAYLIRVHDDDGKLIRTIERKLPRILTTDAFRQRYLAQFGNIYFNDFIKKITFPKYLNPYHSFTVDEVGRLFVMTQEMGNSPEEKMFDVFSPDGQLMTRASLPDCSRGGSSGWSSDTTD